MPSAVGERLARAGVLGLQGDFREHLDTFQRLGTEAVDVRRPEQLDEIDALVIPGGESTTIGKLLVEWKLLEPLRARAQDGFPVYGSCAGAIIMARDVGRDQPRLAIMDIVVERNAFGRQVDSFETPLTIPALGDLPFPGVFIRAPKIVGVGPGVDVLARLSDGTIVAAQQGPHLAVSFHAELTPDVRLHEYFLKQARVA